MRCQYHVHGCNWTGEQILVKNHEEKCTFKSWLSRCSFCNHSVPASDMEYHLKHQCKNYCCPKCVEREQIDSSTSNAKLKTHTTLAILAKGYNYTQKSPVELTKMFVFHFRRQTPGFVYYVFFKLAYIIIIIQTTSTKNIFHKIKLSTD